MSTAPAYQRHRFPPGIIARAVWLYFRFSLSYRDVEALLAEWGAVLTYEGVVKVTGEPCGRVCDTRRMNEHAAAPTDKRHRFPVAIIGHAVWLYFRFTLSYRDVEELLAERGVILTHETVRRWCRKSGQMYANEPRRRRPRPRDKWHLDEAFIQIDGQQHYLWRAVDQDETAKLWCAAPIWPYLR